MPWTTGYCGRATPQRMEMLAGLTLYRDGFAELTEKYAAMIESGEVHKEIMERVAEERGIDLWEVPA